MYLIGLLFLILVATAPAQADLKDYLPNAAAIQFANVSTSLTLGTGSELKLSSQARKDQYAGLVKAASQLSFKKIIDIKDTGFSWRMSSLANITFSPISIQNDAVFFQETDFNFTRFALGYGPEASYFDGFGTSMILLAPSLLFSHVSWSSPVSGNQLSRLDYSINLSLSYTKKITEKLLVQLAITIINEDPETWNKALSVSQGFPISVESAVTQNSGLGFIYVF